MSVLSDRDIRAALEAGEVAIEPYDPADLQPSSVDLHLDRSFRVFRNNRYAVHRRPRPAAGPDRDAHDRRRRAVHPPSRASSCSARPSSGSSCPNDLVARLEGKALALDTPIPTPSGWRTMGDLEPGDFVFDETGAPTRVVAATPPMLGSAVSRGDLLGRAARSSLTPRTSG